MFQPHTGQDVFVVEFKWLNTEMTQTTPDTNGKKWAIFAGINVIKTILAD